MIPDDGGYHDENGDDDGYYDENDGDDNSDNDGDNDDIHQPEANNRCAELNTFWVTTAFVGDDDDEPSDAIVLGRGSEM